MRPLPPLPLLLLLPFLPLLPLALAGCKLTEVTVPEGEAVVVVQAVLSARTTEQFVIVELIGSVSASLNRLLVAS